jgi:ABC-type branched-subunit amino acid transport system substrate-binding protein
MGNVRRRSVSVLSLAGIALLSWGCSGGSSGNPSGPTQTGPISVGEIAPITGPAAEIGGLIGAPCIAATDLINKAGGVMGRQLNCVPIDDTGDPADAVPNVTKAIATTSNFDMAMGLETNTAATTIPLVNAAKIPFVTADGLASFSHTTDKYFWRLTASDDLNGAAFAIWAVRKGYKSPAVVFESDIGSEGNLPGITTVLPKLGGKLVANLTIPPDASSYSSVVAGLIAKKPDVLIFSANPQTSATFMSEYKQLNNGTLPPMVTATDSLTPDFFSAVSKVVGTDYVTHDIYLVGSNFDQNTPAFPVYLDALKADSRTAQVADTVSQVGPPGSLYDGMNVLALAMIAANSTIGSVYNSYVLKVVAAKSGAVVVHNFADGKKALGQGKSIQYVGLSGPVAFNKYHNTTGDFAANTFTPDGNGGNVAGMISGSQVLKLMG